MKRKLFALLLAGTVLLAACADGGETVADAGRDFDVLILADGERILPADYATLSAEQMAAFAAVLQRKSWVEQLNYQGGGCVDTRVIAENQKNETLYLAEEAGQTLVMVKPSDGGQTIYYAPLAVVEDAAQFKADVRAARDEQMAADFVVYFQDRWQTVEGAADGMALPLGGAYLPVPPQEANGLIFSLWGDEEPGVLYTQGIVPAGAANPVRVTTECFLSLSDGQLVCNEMTYSTAPEGTVYYRSPYDSESVSQDAYEALRREYLHAAKASEIVEAGEVVDFLRDPEVFTNAVCAARERWRCGNAPHAQTRGLLSSPRRARHIPLFSSPTSE